MNEFIIRLFRRETSSNEFIPVIDGLRFLAIAMVVLYHADGFLRVKVPSFSSVGNSYNFFAFGHQGVQLFFVISGFVLAIPFMRYHFEQNPSKPSLGRYFIRRLTRLEPPYVVSTVLIFILVLLVGRDGATTAQLFESFAASLFYLHNLIFPGSMPLINHVTWSLEIEVQYYLIAPFVIYALCLFRNKWPRRVVILGLIVATSIFSWFIETQIKIGFLSLLNFFQYFLGGIFLCDMYLLDSAGLSRLRGYPFFILGMVLLFLVAGVEHALAESLILRIASPLLIVGFYLIVFGNRFWNRIFSLNILTLIGGMCYSIYLVHPTVIAAVGRVSTNMNYSSGWGGFNYAAQLILICLACLIFAAMFFLLIEKPCMRRDWHLKLWGWLMRSSRLERHGPAEERTSA